MPRQNPMTSTIRQIQGPLGRFLGRAAAKLYPLVVDRCKKQNITPARLVEEDIETSLSELSRQVPSWREFQTIRRRHDTLPILRKRIQLLDEHRDEYLSLERMLLSGAGRFVYRRLKGVPEDEAVNEVLSGFAILLKGDQVKMSLGASFRTLDANEKSVALDVDTTMRSLTNEERRMCYERRWFEVDSDRNEHTGLPSIVQSGHARKIGTYLEAYPFLRDEHLHILRPMVSFVQLHIGEKVKPNTLFLMNDVWLPNPIGKISRLSSHIDPYPDPPGSLWFLGGAVHPVDDAGLKRLRSGWPSFRVALKDERFARACSRFSLSLHRDSAEDQIIDHWVALESLFGKGSEIATTVALKVAILIEKDVPLRKLYRKWITAHYAIRSALVHGGDVNSALKRFAKSLVPPLKDVPPTAQAARIFSSDWLKRALIALSTDFAAMDELDDVLLYGFLDRDKPQPGSPRTRPELVAALGALLKKSSGDGSSPESG